jgi:hypothetical protein
MAFLLGCHSGTKISRFEHLARHPNLETALACQVVFGVPAHKIFPGIYAEEVEKIVTERARLLSEQLRARREQDRLRHRKLATLRAIMTEGKHRPPMEQ